MNPEKAEIKMLTVKDFGKMLGSQKEFSSNEVFRLEGAVGALKQAIEKIEYYKNNKLRVMLKDGDLEPFQHSMIIEHVDECEKAINELMESAKLSKIMKQGEIQAFNRSLEMAEQMYKEQAKIVEAGEQKRPDEVVSPLADLQARRAEAMKAKKKKGVKAN